MTVPPYERENAVRLKGRSLTFGDFVGFHVEMSKYGDLILSFSFKLPAGADAQEYLRVVRSLATEHPAGNVVREGCD